MRGLSEGSAERSAHAPARARADAGTRRRSKPWSVGCMSPWSANMHGSEVELDVGRVEPVARAPEAARLGDVGGQRPAAVRRSSATFASVSAVSSVIGSSVKQDDPAFRWSWRFSPTPGRSWRTSMPSARSCVGRADAREHQQLRRADRRRRTGSPRARRSSALGLAVDARLDAGRARAVEQDARRRARRHDVRFGRASAGCR